MTRPPLFDSHCHLDDPRLVEERDDVLDRARQQGVARITTIGCAVDEASMSSALDIARRHPEWITATVGVHPHDARHLTEPMLDRMRALAADPLVVAIGEMGLDFHYDSSPRDTQRDAFRRQIALAREVGKPIVVHTRSAPEQTLAILRDEAARDVGGVIHCFSEDAGFARRALDLGFVSSFSGIVTFQRSVDIQEAARRQPLDALLVETDAPYLAPVPRRGKRNEPAYVAHTAAMIAELRGVPEDTVREASTRNACRLFGLDP